MERSINVRVFRGYTGYKIILKVKGNLLPPSTNSNWIYIQVLHSAGHEIDANTEHYPKQPGWVRLQASDVAFAFSCLTPGLPTEWTHFSLWLQLLPVAIQLSDPPSPGPGTWSHMLIRHLDPEAQLALQIRHVQNWTNHFTSKPAPLRPMLFLPSNEWQSAGPQAESFLSPTSRDHRVLSILLLLFVPVASALVPALLTPCPRLLSQSFSLEAHPDCALTMPGTLLSYDILLSYYLMTISYIYLIYYYPIMTI